MVSCSSVVVGRRVQRSLADFPHRKLLVSAHLLDFGVADLDEDDQEVERRVMTQSVRSRLPAGYPAANACSR